ncbi:hypothetical protein [uncultured Nostoc sp.]|uniref:hypothetical protein n=1 Tax=uncultured Nostoc sp. TaxID=340711 RepID=UPI0035CC0D6F
MKFNIKIAIAFVATATSVFGLASGAMAAGAGGAAGAAAFTINSSGGVTGVAVAAAVGKETATAAAFNNPNTSATGVLNSAYAVGTGGTVAFTALGNPLLAGLIVTSESSTTLSTPQANVLSDIASVQLGTSSSAVVTSLP